MSLAAVAIITIIANHFGADVATLTHYLMNLAITTLLLVMAIMLLAKDGTAGDLGKAWIFFTSFVIFWFTAERIWGIYELVYQINPWPSEADYFWLAGYPLYFAFTFFYMRPFKNVISPRMITASVAVASAVSALLAYDTITHEPNLISLEALLGMAYPIADAICLVPVMIGIILFVRGKVHFFWSCLLIGVLLFVVADYGFLFLSLEGSYYTGSYIDIPYLWAYLFLLIGLYNHLKIFKKRDQNSRFNNQEDLR